MSIFLRPTTPLSVSSVSLSTLSPLSPVSVVSPVTTIKSGPYSTTVQTNYVPTYTTYPTYPYVRAYEYDSGLNDSFLVQKEACKWLHKRMLHKWLYTDEMDHILKFMKVHNGKVELVKDMDEMKENKISKDTEEDLELKADYIKEHLFDEKTMRKLLQRTIEELRYKWYELTQESVEKNIVVDVVERYLNRKFKELIGGKHVVNSPTDSQ